MALCGLIIRPRTAWVNDRVAEDELSCTTRSLYLIRPSMLMIAVVTEGQGFGNPRRRVRAQFSYGGEPYDIVVTDPVVERTYFAQANGTYATPNAVICVSLAAVYDGYAYKLAAAVITPDRAGG